MAAMAQNWQDPEDKSVSHDAPCEADTGFVFSISLKLRQTVPGLNTFCDITLGSTWRHHRNMM